MYLADEFGTGYLVGDEQGLGRNDTGRQKSTVKAVKVLRPDGSSEWDGLGTDTEAIRDQLATQLSRPIADYEPALARGRRTAEVDARRKELAGVAADLVLERRATRRAVAEVLGCTEKAVGTLVRLGAN
jgi:hypothetical protein